ncbi:MAG: mechanosensitive ion channel family protein [Cyclobacteriaceae bacterium]
MELISDWLLDNWGVSYEIQRKIFYSIIAFLVLTVIRYLALRFTFKKITDVKSQYYWRNGIKNTHNAILIIAVGFIWVEQMDSLGTFLGLIGAGLAIALQDPIVNLAAWVFIIGNRPFEVGDRVEIDGMAGDVIDIRYFQFTINEINNWVDADQSTGRIIHIPNGRVFKASQANFTQGFRYIWNEMHVLVTFESDWRAAKVLLEGILTNHTEHMSESAKKILYKASKRYMIYYNNLTPTIYTSVKDSGIQLSMRYLCNPKKRRVTEHEIWEDVLDGFEGSDLYHFAYPTSRVMLDRNDPPK